MTLSRKHRLQQQRILRWYAAHRRDLPWRRTRDPYAILVSEIMLQQTQVDRVVPKYEAWMAAFPTAHALAKAPIAMVLRMWSGLGYNRRALFLQRAVKAIVEGGWPKTVDGMSALPGIGPYTAGAVLSFAFGKRTLAFDVNVQRVVRRAFVGVSPKKKPPEPKTLLAAAERLLPKDASTWQQALMDLGALHCTARPRCVSCPLLATCPSAKAFVNGWREVSVKKQTISFVQSARFVRGRILRHVTQHQSATAAELAHVLAADRVTEERLEQALHVLVREGLLERTGSMYALPAA